MILEEKESSVTKEKRETESKSVEDKDEDVLDKGYAWIIVVGGFFSQVLIGEGKDDSALRIIL